MLVDQKPLVYLWRPFYRFTFDGIVWPFLGRVKALFLAESQAQLQQIASQLSALERQLSLFESNQRAQWSVFEQLYLCVLSDPDRNARLNAEQLLENEWRPSAPEADRTEPGSASPNLRGSRLDHSLSTGVPDETLLSVLATLDRSGRLLSRRLEDLEAENRRRCDALQRLIDANLSSGKTRSGTSPAGGTTHG